MYVPACIYARTRARATNPLHVYARVRMCVCVPWHAGARVARIHAREIDEQRRHYVGFDDDIDFLAQSLLLLLYIAKFAIREI